MTNVTCDVCHRQGPLWADDMSLTEWLVETEWMLLANDQDEAILLCPACQPREDEDRETIMPGDEHYYRPPGAVDR